MRRKEREIKDRERLLSIISRAKVCRLALSEDDQPYVVPLCFGHRDGFLYFHTARKGKKLDILRKNDRVCFEIDIDQELMPSAEACKWGMGFMSVIGFGRALLLEDPGEKREALDIIMAHYAEGAFDYRDEVIRKTVIIKVGIESMTGKSAGY